MAETVASDQGDMDTPAEIKATLTPPASEETDKVDESGSELSDLDFDDDEIGEIEPDHYYEGGKIPVFKPTMDQFRSFKKFIAKIDKYGMKSGIVKVIPPKEWRDSLPALDEAVKTIKVKNPITQEFAGTPGTYTQANIEKQRSYNLPQWKALTEESNHQPPAGRGQRRRNQDKVVTPATTKPKVSTPLTLPNGKKRGPGRPRKRPLPEEDKKPVKSTEEEDDILNKIPPTPTSPSTKPSTCNNLEDDTTDVAVKEEVDEVIEMDEHDELITSPVKGKAKGRQPKSVSSRRKYNRRDAIDAIDEEAFKNFDYRVTNQDEFTPERCAELETMYWKGITYNHPMYGADMPGSLFDDSTTSWNVAKLENLLDVLGQKVPGVNTAYLYLGMWKATFAWHLEDVDLYSINYIHFGAPKQWYSISQEDARRFEAAMKSVWPNDAKQCAQFLRHKTYLISPALLQSQFNIRVNRLVHHEGEFVITFPYGYHSGYNLGYNCAESVNFATESWLEYGRVAKKCNCEADSVWVDVEDIERKLRGEKTPEYYEETDEEVDDVDEDEEDDDGTADLPTPPASVEGKPRQKPRKRKRDADAQEGRTKVKRIRIRIKAPAKEPCDLCPNDNPSAELLPTDNGKMAHRLCAEYTLETYISDVSGSEKIYNVANIPKARRDLKCNYCRSKSGTCFQCSHLKCFRAYHATCAAAAGVQIHTATIPVWGEDGVEYTDIGIDFRCRTHRKKRGKMVDGETLEQDSFIMKQAKKLHASDIIQMQYHQGEIFAGTVVENRESEQTVLVDLLPRGDRFEVEYKWILFFDPADSQLPVPSANAQPLPSHVAKKTPLSEEVGEGIPKEKDPFTDPQGPNKWAEFNRANIPRNRSQVAIDIFKPKQLWFYLGKTSTEAKAQYTEDPRKPRHNPESIFKETVKPLLPPVIPIPAQRRSFPATHYPGQTSVGINMHAQNAAMVKKHQQRSQAQPQNQSKSDKPYQYKPRANQIFSVDPQALNSQRAFQMQVASQAPVRRPSTPKQPTGSEKANGRYRPTSPHMTESYYHHSSAMAGATTGELQRIGTQSNQASQPLSGYKQSYDYHVPQNQRYMRPDQHTPTGQKQQDQLRKESQELLQQQRQIDFQQMQQPRAAPVANMGGGTSNNPFRPPSKPAPAPIAKMGSTKEPVHPILMYPYLKASYDKQAKVYQSPYAKNGGFTMHWMPNPLRQSSLPRSQQFQPLPQAAQPHARHVHQPQYQTEQQFQQQVQKEAQQPPGHNYDKMWARINRTVESNASKPPHQLGQGFHATARHEGAWTGPVTVGSAALDYEKRV
ncbi:MAG: hypothetical protein M1835_005233 [Candelina submexicana]|nr:MAG: hypothetical protein M1835_005233 [Candelina submexicana]